MHDTIARADIGDDWRILACNAALAGLVGAGAAGELVGRHLSEFVADRILLDRLLAGMRASGKSAGLEIDLQRLDGGSLPVVLLLSGEAGKGGAPVSLVAQIVEAADTGRRNVLGARRMEAVGRLAGGIAHDFNNLLMIISGHTERLLELTRDHRTLHASALAIQQASERAASLTRQLLAFGRRQVLQARVTDLRALVAAMQPRLEAILGHAIGLRLELGETMAVSVDAVRLEDALASLAANARTAMPEGGTMTIRTGSMPIADAASRPRPWIRPGTYASLVVEDTGVGMDEGTLLRVFEPFFTTRGVRGGAGLGLATVYGFVKQSHGYIFVESEVGRGASFTILFPVAAPRRSSAGAGDDRAALETILVVSDDEPFRTELGDALRLEGYHVLDSPSGDRAAEVFAAYTDRVHLLLVDTDDATDSARSLVNRLQALDPLLQALYLTSGASAVSASRGGRPVAMAVLLKPVSVDAVVARVREALDSGEGR